MEIDVAIKATTSGVLIFVTWQPFYNHSKNGIAVNVKTSDKHLYNRFNHTTWNDNTIEDVEYLEEDVVIDVVMEAMEVIEDLVNHIASIHLPKVKAFGLRKCQPFIQHGEWIYPIDWNQYVCVARILLVLDDYQIFHKAISSNHNLQWKMAMPKEFDSLMAKLPFGSWAIKNKWICKQKLGAKGHVDRYKMHLVAKGFTRCKGINFNETFTPTIKVDLIGTILVMAIIEDMKLAQFDVKKAYLHGKIKKELYKF